VKKRLQGRMRTYCKNERLGGKEVQGQKMGRVQKGQRGKVRALRTNENNTQSLKPIKRR